MFISDKVMNPFCYKSNKEYFYSAGHEVGLKLGVDR